MDSVRQACSSKVVSVHGGGLVAVALTTALAIGACGKEPDKGGARVDAQAAASAIGAATDAA
jgi:hypothetical protein